MNYTTEQLLASIIEGIHAKKGTGIVTLNFDKLEHAICEYFVICDALSSTQVDAIADSVEFTVKKELNLYAQGKEGKSNAEWILIDFGSIMVHVFQTEVRDHYSLEDLWADAKKTTIKDQIS